MNEYEQKQEMRRQRLYDRAERKRKEASATHERAEEMLSVIPPGQPILIGHHSEQRDRNYRERIHRTFRKAGELADAADHYEERAEAVGKGGVSSDDPDAVEKLKAKLQRLEDDREGYKKINAAWRKAGRPGPEDPRLWEPIAEALGIENRLLERIRKDMRLCPWHKAAIPPYVFQNLGGNIRRIKERIEELEKQHERAKTEAPAETVSGNGFRVVEDPEDNRIRVVFDAKPCKEVCRFMRSEGFVFSRYNMAWQRQLNNSGRHAAQRVAAKLPEML